MLVSEKRMLLVLHQSIVREIQNETDILVIIIHSVWDFHIIGKVKS